MPRTVFRPTGGLANTETESQCQATLYTRASYGSSARPVKGGLRRGTSADSPSSPGWRPARVLDRRFRTIRRRRSVGARVQPPGRRQPAPRPPSNAGSDGGRKSCRPRDARTLGFRGLRGPTVTAAARSRSPAPGPTRAPSSREQAETEPGGGGERAVRLHGGLWWAVEHHGVLSLARADVHCLHWWAGRASSRVLGVAGSSLWNQALDHGPPGAATPGRAALLPLASCSWQTC